jgi:formylglycine-generating enzyme required for sulfatase activity
VVSSRPIGRGEALEDLPRLELLPLDVERRREFLENWFRHAGRADWRQEAATALAHVTDGRRLGALSGIPLYLTLLAVLWEQGREQGKRPPGDLATLYDEVFALLLAGRHKREPRPMPAEDDVREALVHLAYGMTEDDLWAEPVQRLEARLRAPELEPVRRRLAAVDAWRDDLYAFLRDVHERTQILGPHDGGHGDWRFWHRTFREALTAERLRRQVGDAGGDALVEWARQLAEGGESRWAEPLALLAGRLPDADALVLRLGEANPKLAVRAAAFAQGLKPETVQKTLQLTDDLDVRSQVFESIPDQLDDGEACLALVEQLREGNRDGFDLYWLWWIVEEVERRWGGGDRTAALLARFFEHVSAPEDPELLWTVETPLDARVELWRKVPAGVDWVGSPESEEGRDVDEGPRHQVEIASPYWIGAVPITNAQYAAFDPGKAPHPWEGVSEDELRFHPRVNLTWYEAVSFCRWLATLPGFAGSRPRLPIEEEWEVACRAGSETRFWRGDQDEDLDVIGWYDKNSGNRTHRVGGKPPNGFGLYDVHGNVWEWTASPWDEERYKDREGKIHPVDPTVSPADLAGGPRVERVMRGGSCWFFARYCRSAYRWVWNPWDVFRFQGFRVLLSSAPSRDRR